ncbi:MAG: hypothetical protein KME60_11420 [Cyanomargarita calcarea GSE-NOS-MK-12-04C]|jgi:hypothetical protein|uniref:Uncharacterized protein n=1 Tax=Cyanomargarita calcarea GSE-NOS-MK-12-04C TaxID=2839659 RepID=A0A951USK3_9CYAN|nr:hypothetical protein [Cyanomargarita calcarea GSE-NOS-MK-12-04C]
MKQATIEALELAYLQLRRLCEDLYSASEIALDNDDFDDAVFLQSQADKLFEEAINLEYIISEQEAQ